ncbi:MAG: AAA family ATPase [Candidatus Aenigmarchaeota archaeon]|nr:AAA family ATPase [Candidatus Aenigmarchaeota archaeon]
MAYSENIIIANESVLLETHQPEDILHRDGQKQVLAECIRPASSGKRIRNVFLYGPPGTGKTLLTKWAMSLLEKSANRIKTVYVNCWSRSTAYAVFGEILQQAEIFVSPRESMISMVRKFENAGKSQEKKFVIALDEVDQLESFEVLYDVSRSGAGLVCISNNPYALSSVDDRIKSSLQVEGLEFPAYSADQMADIIGQRAKYGLVPNAISRDDIKIIARLCSGDSRVGIEMLRKAALIAENENRKKILVEHIKKAFSEPKFMRKTKLQARLNDDEMEILKIIRSDNRIIACRIYELYSRIVPAPVTERAVRKYLKKFAKLGLIKYEGDVRWREYFAA